MDVREMLKEAVKNSDVEVYTFDMSKVYGGILFDYINKASYEELKEFAGCIRYIQGVEGKACRIAFYGDRALAVYGLKLPRLENDEITKGMTANEIIQVLEYCNYEYCEHCPLWGCDCMKKCHTKAIEIIRTQQEEIERLRSKELDK